MWRTYGKSLTAVGLAVFTAAHGYLSDGGLTQIEDVQIAIAFATALGVYLVPVIPQWPWAKTVVGVLLAVLNVLVTLIIDGVSPADVTELALAALTVITVGVAPAESVNLPPARTSAGGR